MKRVLLVTLMIFATLVFAKGNIETWDGNTSCYLYESGVFTMTSSGDLLLKLYQPASKNGQIVKDFGYYFVTGDKKGEETSLVTKFTGNGKPVMTGNSEYTVTGLKKDDQIGFYVKYDEGNAEYSQGDKFFSLTNVKKDINYYTFGMDNSWEDGGALAFTFDGIIIVPDEPAPAGQPLPGVFSTCLVAGIMLSSVGAHLHRKKQA